LDGIIITSATIACFISDEEFVEFCKRYEGIPLVSLGIVVPHATSILVDNKPGMKSHFKKIVYISGPPTNTDSVERLEAYCEALRENDIEIDDGLIFYGDFMAQSGYGK